MGSASSALPRTPSHMNLNLQSPQTATKEAGTCGNAGDEESLNPKPLNPAPNASGCGCNQFQPLNRKNDGSTLNLNPSKTPNVAQILKAMQPGMLTGISLAASFPERPGRACRASLPVVHEKNRLVNIGATNNCCSHCLY